MKTIYTFLLLCIITFANSKLLAQTSFYSQNFEVTNDWTISPSYSSPSNNNNFVWSSAGGNTNSGAGALQVWTRISSAWDGNYSNNATSDYLTAKKVFNLSSITSGCSISFKYHVMCKDEAGYDDLTVTVNGSWWCGNIRSSRNMRITINALTTQL